MTDSSVGELAIPVAQYFLALGDDLHMLIVTQPDLSASERFMENLIIKSALEC